MSLPVHGKISCHKCYQTSVDDLHQPHNLWNMRNDPAAWGGSEPEVLVLGFSKGSTQANIYQNGKFEDIAFGGVARNRLDEALKRIGVLPLEEHITKHIEDPDSRFAFGSLVRCSLTREGKDGKHASSGPLVVKSFKEIPDILNNCAQKFLAGLPEKTKTILMLGVADAYIDGCYKVISNIYPAMKKINDVAYCDGNKLFVHITHPSPGNGHFSSWKHGNLKFEYALAALKQRNGSELINNSEQENIGNIYEHETVTKASFAVRTTGTGMKISGIDAVKILEKYREKVQLLKKDNTDKFWSYKMRGGSNAEFAFDPATKRNLVIRFDQEPPRINGVEKIENITGKSVSTALKRVFSGSSHQAKFKASIHDEETLLAVLEMLK